MRSEKPISAAQVSSTLPALPSGCTDRLTATHHWPSSRHTAVTDPDRCPLMPEHQSPEQIVSMPRSLWPTNSVPGRSMSPLPREAVWLLGTEPDLKQTVVECCFTSTKTVGLLGTGAGRPLRLTFTQLLSRSAVAGMPRLA